jgi:MFS transporter, DHA1 family, multidrug resistance protein
VSTDLSSQIPNLSSLEPGPLILGFIVPTTSWRFTQYVSLMFMFAAFLFGVGMPETYPREILRRRARRAGLSPNLPKAESGVTLIEMAHVTIIQPLIMLVSEPIVIMSSLLLGANFGFLFQWFITVPVALPSTYGFTVQRVGLAFTSALVGTVLALIMTVAMEKGFPARGANPKTSKMPNIEHRLYPAMAGAPLMCASLFIVGNTAMPDIHYVAPIIGTAIYVWGSLSVIIGMVAYLFDAYPPKGTLSALTAAACFRIALAGIIPLIVIPSFMQATPKWTLGAFGFVILALTPVPYIMFFFGRRMREKSRYNVG